MNVLAPNVNREPWTDEEIEKLLDLTKRLGNKWKLIAKSFPGRPEGGVKNAYYSATRRLKRTGSARGCSLAKDTPTPKAAATAQADVDNTHSPCGIKRPRASSHGASAGDAAAAARESSLQGLVMQRTTEQPYTLLYSSPFHGSQVYPVYRAPAALAEKSSELHISCASAVAGTQGCAVTRLFDTSLLNLDISAALQAGPVTRSNSSMTSAVGMPSKPKTASRCRPCCHTSSTTACTQAGPSAATERRAAVHAAVDTHLRSPCAAQGASDAVATESDSAALCPEASVSSEPSTFDVLNLLVHEGDYPMCHASKRKLQRRRRWRQQQQRQRHLLRRSATSTSRASDSMLPPPPRHPSIPTGVLLGSCGLSGTSTTAPHALLPASASGSSNSSSGGVLDMSAVLASGALYPLSSCDSLLGTGVHSQFSQAASARAQ